MKSRGESINHFNGVRLRVIGDGDLQVAAYRPGGENTDILDETLIPYPMVSPTSNQPVLGMNVRRQRISLEIKVEEINEWFQINRLVVFYKVLFTSFVGRG
jgi:hypothetical protein